MIRVRGHHGHGAPPAPLLIIATKAGQTSNGHGAFAAKTTPKDARCFAQSLGAFPGTKQGGVLTKRTSSSSKGKHQQN